MCGRFGIDPELPKQVEEDFHIPFKLDADSNICPSMMISTIIKTDTSLQQFNGPWGIQPSWSKKLLINAQSETASTKPTFKNSVKNYRCIIPISYWYEWCTTHNNPTKIKYQFREEKSSPLYMAGLFFPTNEYEANIVSLTTKPTEQTKTYHHRLPLFVSLDWIETGHFNLETRKQFSIHNAK